jgi:hypothetical protein
MVDGEPLSVGEDLHPTLNQILPVFIFKFMRGEKVWQEQVM